MPSNTDPLDKWYHHAACRGDLLLFEEAGLNSRSSAGARSLAEQICASCPVTQECLEDALKYEGDVWSGFQDEGYRAGTTRRTRRKALKKKNPRS